MYRLERERETGSPIHTNEDDSDPETRTDGTKWQVCSKLRYQLLLKSEQTN